MPTFQSCLKTSVMIVVCAWEYIAIAVLAFLLNDHLRVTIAEGVLFFAAIAGPVALAGAVVLWPRRMRRLPAGW